MQIRSTSPRSLSSACARLLACAASLWCIVPATAQADGRRWPGKTITYFNATQEKKAVRLATEAWNASGVKIRFRPASSRRSADVVVVRQQVKGLGCGTGLGSLGYTPGRQARVWIAPGPDSAGQGCAWPGMALVAAHEFGHVLGLEHAKRGCALMRPAQIGGIASEGCGAEGHVGQWRCRIVEPADVQRAIKLYGGKPRAIRQDPWCDILGPLGAPASVTAASRPDGTVLVQFPAPPSQSVPPFLASGGTGVGYTVFRSPGPRACPGPDADLSGEGWYGQQGQISAAPGAPQPVLLSDGFGYASGGAGLYCFAVQLTDRIGRTTASAFTTLQLG